MGHKVVAIAYDQLCTFEFGCTVELFALPRPELPVSWYEFAVCAAERGPLRAAGGVQVRVPHSLRLLDSADTIVIPGWRSPDEPPPELLLTKLRRAFARGARLCSICSGVFVLAAAGVLDGRRATTHWRYVAPLAARYPRIRVEPNALYVDEGRVLTSAGSAAGLDMLLHLVRRDHGARIANQVAQRLVIPPHREGDQAQFVPRPLASDGRGRLARLMDFVRAHPAAPHTLASLARRAAMSPRTLQREFNAATGMAPYEWLVAERIEHAKELLETTRLPAPSVAARAGLGSAESLRHHFRQRVGTTPSAYRRRFSRRV
jgi:AraC family transcriptional activator FtrA